MILEVHTGDEALHWLADPANYEGWSALYSACPWRTPFLSPAFARIWYRHYKSEWTPFLLCAHAHDQALCAVMPLARQGDHITGVGAHQAEYQGWLSTPHSAFGFINAALKELCRTHPDAYIRLRYLPPQTPPGAITTLARHHRNLRLRRHSRPLLRVDLSAIYEIRKKKGNRSKLNRLRRLGEVSFHRLQHVEDAQNYLDQIIPLYDFRQGALNDSCPFTDDPRKRAFHLDWMASCPEHLYASVATLNGETIAAFIGVVGSGYVANAIVTHAPSFARFSPGKMHLYRVAEDLAVLGTSELDLTPGGDPWKDQIATHHDQVFEIEIWANRATAFREFATETVRHFARTSLAAVRIPPSALRNASHSLAQCAKRLITSVTQNLVPHTETRNVYSGMLTGSLSLPFAPQLLLREDALEYLTHFWQWHGEPCRQAVLAVALRRLETGEHIYTVTVGPDPLLLCWIHPDASRFSSLQDCVGPHTFLQSAPILYGIRIRPDETSAAIVESALREILTVIHAHHGSTLLYVYDDSGSTRLATALTRCGFDRYLAVAVRKWLLFAHDSTHLAASTSARP